jgi:peptidoglycan/xylan/chitin deacetylase (PgdA/CDA1 family)
MNRALLHGFATGAALRGGRALEIAAFAYHDVGEDPASTGFQRPGALPFKLTPRAFEQHLDAIARSGLAPSLIVDVDMTQPGRYLLLTFDDGGKSALRIGEELCRRGWRGHFFIVTSRIGGSTFLDAAGIRELRSCGHVIGSHSHTHPDIARDRSAEFMVEEWQTSCAVLADLLGEPMVTASVPGGDISATTLRSAATAGLRYLFTSEPWLTPRRVAECWILGRVSPKVGTTPAEMSDLARFHGWSRALLLRRAKGIVRRSCPPIYRLYVKRLTRERH